MFIKKEFFKQFSKKLLAFFHGEVGSEIHVAEKKGEITITGPKKDNETPGIEKKEPEQVAKNQPQNFAKAGEEIAGSIEGNTLTPMAIDIKPEDINKTLGIEAGAEQKEEIRKKLEVNPEDKKINMEEIFDRIDDPSKKEEIENQLSQLLQKGNTHEKMDLSTVTLNRKNKSEVTIKVDIYTKELTKSTDGTLMYQSKKGNSEFSLKREKNGMYLCPTAGPKIKLGKTEEEIRKALLVVSRMSA